MTPLHEQPLVVTAIRAAVRDAGFNVGTRTGDAMVEWSISQVKTHGRVPKPQAIFEKAAALGLEPESPAVDPESVERDIAEARERGDWVTASRLEDAVRRVREAPGPLTLSEEETAAIAAARERAAAAETPEERRAAWQEASNLQRRAEGRMAGGTDQAEVEYPPQYQPSGGLNEAQLALLEADDTPLADRLDQAQQAGEHVVASLLQSRIERESVRAS